MTPADLRAEADRLALAALGHPIRSDARQMLQARADLLHRQADHAELRGPAQHLTLDPLPLEDLL